MCNESGKSHFNFIPNSAQQRNCTKIWNKHVKCHAVLLAPTEMSQQSSPFRYCQSHSLNFPCYFRHLRHVSDAKCEDNTEKSKLSNPQARTDETAIDFIILPPWRCYPNYNKSRVHSTFQSVSSGQWGPKVACIWVSIQLTLKAWARYSWWYG